MAAENTKFNDAGVIIENVLASGRKILLPDEAMDIIKSSGIFIFIKILLTFPFPTSLMFLILL